jgi:hypothetical protein
MSIYFLTELEDILLISLGQEPDTNTNKLQILFRYIVFLVLVIIESYVFFRLRFKIDPSGIVTLLIYLLVALMRCFND